MNERAPTFALDPEASTGARDVRLTVVQEKSAHPLVDTTVDDWVTAIPHLLAREIVAFCALVILYGVVSYAWNAPLLDLADPTRTPNPAKAPWYFLGLQELLHYYPPLISGIALPGLVVLALVVVPYFDVNIERKAFLTGAHFGRHLAAVWVLSAAACAGLYLSSKAGPVWPLIGTTALIVAVMSVPALAGFSSGPGRWIATRSIPFWVFTWFLIASIALTVIGVYFRGPGWSFTLPWRDGVYE